MWRPHRPLQRDPLTEPVASIFRIRTPEDFDRIPFHDGVAAVEVPVELLDHVKFRNEHRGDSPRLSALKRSIRTKGYRPFSPITARIGRLGRWVILDGGNRLRAAREVSREFWTNLFGPKVGSLYFVLYLSPDSWSRTTAPPGVDLSALRDGDAAESRDSWERANKRRQAAEKPKRPG